MDENTSIVDGAPVDGGKTSDQILAEIEAAQRQLSPKPSDDKGSDLEPQTLPPGDQVEPTAADKPVEPEVASDQPEVENAPEQSDKADAEIEGWMKKKGFKSVSDMAKSLRHLERKLHEKGRQPEQREIEPRFEYQAPPQARPMVSSPSLEELAKRYNLPPEDFERVMPLINDATDLKMRMGIQPLAQEVKVLRRELARERELKSLEEDPHFHNREVLKEVYQIIENDPTILQREPEPYQYAYKEALANMGRRFVEGMTPSSENQDDTRKGLPRTPPPLGRGAASGSKGSPLKSPSTKMTQEKFNSLSSAEMEKYLASRGLMKAEW